jgi:hypothetical protein
MQTQRNGRDDADSNLSEEQIDGTVLDFMLCGSDHPWSVDEIARELGNEPDAHDAVARLTGTGLVHRLNEFVFPTRTARRAEALHIGSV